MSTYTRPIIKTELPGPKAREVVEMEEKYLLNCYPRPDYRLVAQKASGMWIEDPDNNVFLDCNAGVAVCSTGHCHPEVVKAISEQASTLMHLCGSDYYYPTIAQLGKKLNDMCPVQGESHRTHFGNSGTEAIETAIKLAMSFTHRQKLIAFYNSFHGRTLGSLSLTSSRASQRLGFIRQALDVAHAPYPNPFRHFVTGKPVPEEEVVKDVITWIEDRMFTTTTPPKEVAAIVVEAVQGEGGYVPAPRSFLRELRRICDTHGILLIVDEVQSGMGRTGKMFALDHYDIKPDILCLAKGIASGMPISACISDARLHTWTKGAHGSTFGGNPVACAAALKTIELLEGGLVENAAKVGAHLQTGLLGLKAKYPCIGDVRGFGLMLGVDFVVDQESWKPNETLRNAVENECFSRGLIVLGCGTSTIRFSPPLIMTEDNANVAIEIFDLAIQAAQSKTSNKN